MGSVCLPAGELGWVLIGCLISGILLWSAAIAIVRDFFERGNLL